MRWRRPFTTATLLACAAHVVGLVFAHVFAPIEPLWALAPPSEQELEDIDVSPAEAPLPEEPPAPQAQTAAPEGLGAKRSAPDRGRAGEATRVGHAAAAQPPPPGAGPVATEGSPTGIARAPTVVFATDLRMVAAGAPHPYDALPLGHEAPPTPTTTSQSGGVVEALDAHDVAVGLGRGGAVLALAEEAARGPDAPVRGSATLDVTIREGGALAARVVDASGDADAWSRVAATLTHIDPNRLRIPPGAHGWHVVVRVEAKLLFPDGRDQASLHGFRGSIKPSALSDAIAGKPGARGSSTGPGGPDHVGGGPTHPPPLGGALGPRQATGVAAGVITGLLGRILPTPTLEMQGKVCSVALTITPLGVGLGGGCSLENIGAHATRVVSGRIVSEGRL